MLLTCYVAWNKPKIVSYHNVPPTPSWYIFPLRCIEFIKSHVCYPYSPWMKCFSHVICVVLEELNRHSPFNGDLLSLSTPLWPHWINYYYYYYFIQMICLILIVSFKKLNICKIIRLVLCGWMWLGWPHVIIICMYYFINAEGGFWLNILQLP